MIKAPHDNMVWHFYTKDQKEAMVASCYNHWKLVVQQNTSGRWHARVVFEDAKLDEMYLSAFGVESPGVYHKKMHKAVRGAMDYYAAFVAEVSAKVVEARYTTTAKVELP